ncbi:mechanosensitive ion channel protein MscS [Streptomonospora alba]|uniref:Mechanosensitive ion channel protein MscS n=1 Tax=Streptomonospora alba TaxID=183763 RepID=A0A0C2G822_9ACTN|nr:mechanosensitive ion channel domain-containing protein [Streptomonospora alba]KIH99428.1 mechanosensitive ion channel protein MscS [Streptomonospora alba]
MSFMQWVGIGATVLIAVLVIMVAHWLLTHQLSKVSPLAGPLVRHCRFSAYAAASVIGVNIALPDRQEMPDRALFPIIDHFMTILMIGAMTWFALGLAYAATDLVLDRLASNNGDDDHHSRRLQTQVRLLRRIAASIIGVIAIAAILFTFPAVQGLGAGLLASAGLLSVVAGLAAQSTLGNIFAGLQLAFSNALRLNDVIVFQGEWGRVEELSLTMVTIRMWDERRLIVPVSYFATTPFENWTKQGASITGWVLFQVDWEAPIGRIREEVGAYVAHHPLWDGRRWSLQATDILDDGIVQLRAVVTTADSDARWDLCCDLREHLITHINEHMPQALPRRRTEFLTAGDQEPPYAAVFPESAVRRDSRRGAGSPGPDGSLAVNGQGGSETRDGTDGSGDADG